MNNKPFNAKISDYKNWYTDQKSRCDFFNDIERIETSPGGIFCGCDSDKKVSNIEIKETKDEVILRGSYINTNEETIVPVFIIFKAYNNDTGVKSGNLSVVFGTETQLLIDEKIIKDRELHSTIYSPLFSDRSVVLDLYREDDPSSPVDRTTKFKYHVKYSAVGSSIEFSGVLSRDLDNFEYTDELIKWKKDIKPVTIKGINSDMLYAICKLNNKWLDDNITVKKNYPWLSYFGGLLANAGCAGIVGAGSFLCSAAYGAINTYIQTH